MLGTSMINQRCVNMPLLVKEHKQVNRSPTERAEHQDHIKFQKQ